MAVVLLSSACSNAPADGGPTAAGGAGGGGGSFATSTCGPCVRRACPSQESACEADPDCATYLGCLEACPSEAEGEPEGACAAACPSASSSTGAAAESALKTCLTTGPGGSCCDIGAAAGAGGTAGAGAAGAGAGGLSFLHQSCTTPPDPSESPCRKCEDTYCCDTYATCENDPSCHDMLEPCLQKTCADKTGADENACFHSCYEKFADGLAAYVPRLACGEVKCFGADQCGKAPDPCSECQTTKCLDPYAACAADVECFLIRDCLETTCPEITSTCLMACESEHLAGKPLFDAMSVCAVQQCGDACGG